MSKGNSANEQNASLLAGFPASVTYFRASQIGCLLIFQGHIAGYITGKKKNTDVFEYKNSEITGFIRKYFFKIKKNSIIFVAVVTQGYHRYYFFYIKM